MPFTESVRSFQVPETPATFAWPPRMPSVPTSQATRVTSEAKELRRVTMVLTISADLRNWPWSRTPLTSRGICWRRSPSATESMTRIISFIGLRRLSARELLALTVFRQEPFISGSWIRSSTLPCLPTSWDTRSNSLVMSAAMSMISLSASAILPGMPVQSSGMRVVKSPLRNALSVARRVCISRVSSTAVSLPIVCPARTKGVPGAACRPDAGAPGQGNAPDRLLCTRWSAIAPEPASQHEKYRSLTKRGGRMRRMGYPAPSG
ncbi:hypothetical protein D3C84_229860 [compost metagenome]